MLHPQLHMWMQHKGDPQSTEKPQMLMTPFRPGYAYWAVYAPSSAASASLQPLEGFRRCTHSTCYRSIQGEFLCYTAQASHDKANLLHLRR